MRFLRTKQVNRVLLILAALALILAACGGPVPPGPEEEPEPSGPSNVIVGVLKDASGAPLVGAQVVLGRDAPASGSSLALRADRPASLALGFTDEQGQFGFDVSQEGDYTLTSLLDSVGAFMRVTVVRDEDGNLVAPAVSMSAEQLGAVSGRVDGRGAGIQAFLAGTSFLALTDAEGEFLISRVPAGTYRALASLGGSAGTSVEVTVAPGVLTELSAPLQLGPVITGLTPSGLLPVEDPEEGAVFEDVRIVGTGFGERQGTSILRYGWADVPAALITSWSDTEIRLSSFRPSVLDRSTMAEVELELEELLSFMVVTAAGWSSSPVLGEYHWWSSRWFDIYGQFPDSTFEHWAQLAINDASVCPAMGFSLAVVGGDAHDWDLQPIEGFDTHLCAQLGYFVHTDTVSLPYVVTIIPDHPLLADLAEERVWSPPQVVDVVLAPASIEVDMGQEGMIEWTVQVEHEASTVLLWSSSDEDVATVWGDWSSGAAGGAGILGVGPGTATITATSAFDPSKSDSVVVTVIDRRAVVGVTVVAPAASLYTGEEYLFEASVEVEYGAPTSVAWSSSDENVVVHGGGGYFYPAGAGTATIRATSTFDPTKSGSVVVTVVDLRSVLSVTVVPSSVVLDAGEEYWFDVAVEEEHGAPTEVSWSSSDENVMTHWGSGYFYATGPGMATITATSVFDASVSGSAVVTVNDWTDVPGVIAVAVNPASVSLQVGETLQFEADVVTVGGASTSVSWSSSNETVAVVDAYGLVEAVAEGSAIIMATSDSDVAVSGTAFVTVTDAGPAVHGVSVYPSSTIGLVTGHERVFDAWVETTGGASGGVSWSSSDPAVATVDAMGVSQYAMVTAVSEGQAIITATSTFDPSFSSSVTVNVTDQGVFSVTIVAPATDLVVGGTYWFDALVEAVDSASSSVNWYSSNEGVVTVVNFYLDTVMGRVTAVGTGTATITAVSSHDGSVFGEVTVTVTAP